MYVKRTYRKRARKPIRRAVRKSRGPSKALTRAVKTIIHKSAETKEVYHALDLTNFNSGINVFGDICQLVPNCGNGTAQNQRVGEQIRAQRLTIRGHTLLSMSNNSLSNSRIAMRMMVVCPKAYVSLVGVTNNLAWMSNLLRKGGANTAFTGVISDLYCPINTDAITKYYDKVIYTTVPTLTTTNIPVGGTGVNTASVYDTVNSVKFFNISIKCKNKLLKYDGQLDGFQPQNWSPVLIVGYVHLDGAAPDVATTQLAMAFDSVMTYEDM